MYERRTKFISLELLHSQEFYVATLWKYMVYLYGYDQAAMRFASMVKSVLDMFSRVQQLPVDLPPNSTLNPTMPLSESVTPNGE